MCVGRQIRGPAPVCGADRGLASRCRLDGTVGAAVSGRLDRSILPLPIHALRDWHGRRTGGCDVQTGAQTEIIEAAYALDALDVQWQYRLTDLVAEQWGGTAASVLYDASEPTHLTCERVIMKMAGERSVIDAPRSIPLRDAALRQALFVTRPHLAQLADLLRPELAEMEECRGFFDLVRDIHPGPFSLVLRTLDRNNRGLFFILPSRPIGDRMRAMWGEIAVHMSLAYRLRCALVKASDRGDRSKADPAVLRRALRQAANNVLRDVALWSHAAPTRRPSGTA